MNEKAHAILVAFDPSGSTDSFIESYFEMYFNPKTKEVEVDMKVFKKVLMDMVSPGLDTTATGDMNFTDLWQPRVKFQIS